MELDVRREGAVEVWTILGEARRNALTVALVRELAERIATAGRDRTLRAVILTGQGEKAFCAGADLKERARMSMEEVHAFLRSMREAFRAIEKAPQPYVAALNGAALGGGLELALACDLRVVEDGVEVGLPEVGLGIIPGAGGTQRLPRLVGVGRAKDLILSGRRVGSGEALAMGLVSRIAPPGRLIDEALALAGQVARNAPIALRQAKRAVEEGLALPLDQALSLEHALYQPCLSSKDRLEALRAFAEKRPPVFEGE